MTTITAQSTPEQRLLAGDLMTARAMADKANASREVTALFNTGDIRALDAPGTMTLDGHAEYLQPQEKRNVLDAEAVKRMGSDGTLSEYPQGNPDLPHIVLYSWTELLDALGIAPTNGAVTEDDDADQEPGDIVSVEGAARQLMTDPATVAALVESGSITNWTTARGTDPDVDRYKPATVSVAEVKATMVNTLGITTEKPGDLASPKQAAWEVGNGVTSDDIRDAVAAGEVADHSDHIQVSGSDGSTRATDYVTAGIKVSVAEARDYFSDDQ